MTLFSPTGTGNRRARSALQAILLLTVLLWWAIPAPAETLADLSGPLRDLAFSASPMAARVARVRAGRVDVEIQFKSPAAVSPAAVQALGGRIHAQRDRRLEANVPVATLRDLALLPSVAQVRMPSRLVPLQGVGPNLSQGVQLTNALSLQVNGITGLGVNVAVIDLGFLGFAAAELPANVVTRSFRADGLIDASQHGTACAEVLADMAPQCNMFLLAVATEMDLETALNFCQANKIQIASVSLGLLDGPFAGNSVLDATLNQVRAAGVLVVVAAGNFAQRHWAGDWSPGFTAPVYNQFVPNDDTLPINVGAAGAVVEADLSWFDTAGPTGLPAPVTARDYDLILVDSSGNQVARSAITQDGDDPPSESLFAIVPAAGAYSLKILAVSSNITAAGAPTDHFHLFVPEYDIADMTLQIPQSSLSEPAEATGAFTVGATRCVATLNLPPIVDFPVDTLEPFSSQGPVDNTNGIAKPDISGPDGVVTSLGAAAPTNPFNPFFGTSCATPHVAGAAALLLSESTTRNADELQRALMTLASQQNAFSPIMLAPGGPGAVPATPVQAGVGRLTLRAGLDTEPPVVSISFPANGTTITTSRPTIIGVATDTQTGVDPNTIVLTLDGAAFDHSSTPAPSYNPSTGVVTFTPPSDLSRAAHVVTLQASDFAGNPSKVAVSNFRVSMPTLSAGLHLITLPFTNLLNPDPAAIFGVPDSQLALVRWVPTDTGFSKYRIFPDPLASFTPPDGAVPNAPAGLGYFLNLPSQVVLNVSGQTLSNVSSYTIQLPFGTAEPTGWNMIGDPYTDSIDWATVQFTTNGLVQDIDQAIASGVTEGTLFSFVPAAGAVAGHYEFVPPLQAVMQPMQGYWLHVLKNTAVTIFPSVSSANVPDRKVQTAKQSAPSRDNWQLHLVASAPGMLDTANYLGVSPDASTGHDVGADVPEPPLLTDGISLYFPHADWGRASGHYAQDMQARGAGAKTWKFEVACAAHNANVSVSWPELNASVPGELALRLEDLDGGRTVYMRTVTSYTYTPGKAGVRHFQLVAEPAGASGLRIVSMNAAQTRGGQVVITYQLSAPASVSAEIVNIAGRPVRALVAGRESPTGQNTLVWDGRNGGGVAAPAGTYLLHLTARSADGEAVKRLCPIGVVR